MMELNLGIRAHDMEQRPLEELASAIASKNLQCIQLALKKSLGDMNIKPGSLTPGIARKINREFQKYHIDIAVLGCYVNMIHPDPIERRAGLDFFKEHIRVANDFGCRIVGSETGNIHAENRYTPENYLEEPFQAVVESIRELVDEAEKFGVIVGIEAGVNHPIYSPQTMKRLLDAIPSNNLQVIFDPVNLLTAKTYHHQRSIFQEAFDLFGKRIVILHAKDFQIKDGILETVSVGRGLLDYRYIFSWIKEYKPHIQVLMESTPEKDAEESIVYLKDTYIHA